MEYTSQELLKIIGEPQRTLTSWCESGLLVPIVEPRGPGYGRVFDNRAILEARLIKKLYGLKFQRSIIRIIMNKTRGKISSHMYIPLSDLDILEVKL